MSGSSKLKAKAEMQSSTPTRFASIQFNLAPYNRILAPTRLWSTSDLQFSEIFIRYNSKKLESKSSLNVRGLVDIPVSDWYQNTRFNIALFNRAIEFKYVLFGTSKTRVSGTRMQYTSCSTGASGSLKASSVVIPSVPTRFESIQINLMPYNRILAPIRLQSMSDLDVTSYRIPTAADTMSAEGKLTVKAEIIHSVPTRFERHQFNIAQFNRFLYPLTLFAEGSTDVTYHRIRYHSPILTSIGTLDVKYTRQRTSTVALTSEGVTKVASLRKRTSSVTLDSESALSVNAIRIRRLLYDSMEPVQFNIAPFNRHLDVVKLKSSARVVTASMRRRHSSATCSAVGIVNVDGMYVGTGSGTFTAVADLNGIAVKKKLTGSVLEGKATLSATPVRVRRSVPIAEYQNLFNQVAFNRIFVLAPERIQLPGSGSLTSDSKLTAAARVTSTSTADLNAFGVRVRRFGSIIESTADMYSQGVRMRVYSASMYSQGELYSDITIVIFTIRSPLIDNVSEEFIENFNKSAREVHCMVWVYFDGEDERPVEFGTNEISNVQILEELTSRGGSILGSVSANELDLELNNKNHRFTPSNPDAQYADKMEPGIKIEPFIGITTDRGNEFVPLGQFWTRDWDAPSDSTEVRVPCYDRLYHLGQEYVPGIRVQNKTTIADLFSLVLQSVGLTEDDYTIDQDLDVPVRMGWIEPGKLKDVLQKLSEGVAFVDVDRFNRIRVRSHNIIDTKANDTQIDLDDHKQVITANVPKEYLEVYSKATVKQYKPKLKELQDVLTMDVEIDANDEIWIEETEFNDAPIGLLHSIVVQNSDNVLISDIQVDGYTCTFKLTNQGGEDEEISVVIMGYPIQQGAVERRAENQDMQKYVGKREVRIENSIVQDRSFAQNKADTLVGILSDPNHRIFVNVRGNPALETGTIVTVDDPSDKINEAGTIVRNQLTYDGGLEMDLELVKSRD